MTKHIVAGQELHTALLAEREARVPKGAGGYASEPLCQLQRERSSRGILGAEIVDTNYGWSVRYDSGLQNWGLLASSRVGTIDGSLEAAEAWAAAWVARDPQRRYAWRSI
jgi:hypothetical protein